jgi:hypothetical protein
MGIPKIAAAAVLAVGVSTTPLAQSQKTITNLRDPEIIIAPAVDSPDLVDALIHYDQARYNWDVAHDVVWGIKFYAGTLMSSPPANVTVNSYNLFERYNAGYYARRTLKLDISIEAGGVKNGRAGECILNDADKQAWLKRTGGVVLNEYKIGGRVNSLAIDTALGEYKECGYSLLGVGMRVAELTEALQVYVNEKLLEMCHRDPGLPVVNMMIGDIEPFPTADVLTHLQYLQAINNTRAKGSYRPLLSCAAGLGDEQSFEPLAYYDLDVDTSRVTDDAQLGAAVRSIHEFVTSFVHPVIGESSKFGLIVTGDDSNSTQTDTDEYFIDRAVRKLVRFKQSDILRLADRLVVQSWMATSKMVTDPHSGNSFPVRDIPHTVPDDGPTLTSLIRHVVACRFDEVDCPAFPYRRE